MEGGSGLKLQAGGKTPYDNVDLVGLVGGLVVVLIRMVVD